MMERLVEQRESVSFRRYSCQESKFTSMGNSTRFGRHTSSIHGCHWNYVYCALPHSFDDNTGTGWTAAPTRAINRWSRWTSGHLAKVTGGKIWRRFCKWRSLHFHCRRSPLQVGSFRQWRTPSPCDDCYGKSNGRGQWVINYASGCRCPEHVVVSTRYLKLNTVHRFLQRTYSKFSTTWIRPLCSEIPNQSRRLSPRVVEIASFQLPRTC